MAAPVPLALLITLVPGSLGQLLCLGLQQLVECLLYAATHKFLELPLDYFLIQLYNLFRHGLLAPFRMVCRDFILPEGCKPCLLLFAFQFAKIIVPYPALRGEIGGVQFWSWERRGLSAAPWWMVFDFPFLAGQSVQRWGNANISLGTLFLLRCFVQF